MASFSSAAKPKGATAGSWEDLRKEARQLENQIDTKLVSFSKLGTSIGSTPSAVTKSPSSDRVPLLASADNSDAFEAASRDIETLLARLAVVNDGMAEYASAQPPSAAVHHTLQRHRDILQDYRQEFTKTRANIEALLEREDLLSSVHKDIRDYRSGGGGMARNSHMNLLMTEGESARNSDRLLDEQISIAIETRETLVNQRVAFKAIQTKLNDLSNRFPVINSLVQKINMRKKRDSIIIGAVIGLCLVFILWFAFA